MSIKTVDYKYNEVAERIEALIETNVLKVGDKLLSVRALSKEQGISLSTAFQAYYLLESKGYIEARPQSGYYVKYSPGNILGLPKKSVIPDEAVPVSINEMINSVYQDLRSPTIINLSLAAPAASLLPTAKLNKTLMHVVRESPTSCLHYEHGGRRTFALYSSRYKTRRCYCDRKSDVSRNLPDDGKLWFKSS
jgi:DNA-binding transcriptional MocR family regulator